MVNEDGKLKNLTEKIKSSNTFFSLIAMGFCLPLRITNKELSLQNAWSQHHRPQKPWEIREAEWT